MPGFLVSGPLQACLHKGLELKRPGCLRQQAFHC
jgi:hypothetical protein